MSTPLWMSVPKSGGNAALPTGPVRENEKPGASSGPVMR